MPHTPEFDYYAELEVESSATTEEITASYRRLARVYHPDKNRDNIKAATASFQKVCPAYIRPGLTRVLHQHKTFVLLTARDPFQIQLAHEVLSDPRRRQEYDARAGITPSSPSPPSQPPASSFGFGFAFESDQPFEGFGSGGRFGFGGFGGFGGGFGGFPGGFFRPSCSPPQPPPPPPPPPDFWEKEKKDEEMTDAPSGSSSRSHSPSRHAGEKTRSEEMEELYQAVLEALGDAEALREEVKDRERELNRRIMSGQPWWHLRETMRQADVAYQLAESATQQAEAAAQALLRLAERRREG